MVEKVDKVELKDGDFKVATKEESAWLQVVRNAEQSIQRMEVELEINNIILTHAKKRAEELKIKE